MNFDVVIGNPPYQEKDGGSGASAKPVYNKFIEEIIKMNPEKISLITPSKWFAGGKGLDSFRDFMLTNGHIKNMTNYINSKDVFPRVSIGGGVNYFIYDRDNPGKCEYTNIYNGKTTVSYRDLSEFPVLVRYNEALPIINKVRLFEERNISSHIRSRNPFGFSSKVRGSKEKSEEKGIELFSSDGGSYIAAQEITNGLEMVDNYKVIVGKIISEHAAEPDKNGQFKLISSNLILPPKSICTDSYIVLFNSDKKELAENYYSYLKTKFYRFLLLQAVSSITLSRDRFMFIPDQNYEESWTDEKLFKKYQLSDVEIDAIENIIKPL